MSPRLLPVIVLAVLIAATGLPGTSRHAAAASSGSVTRTFVFPKGDNATYGYGLCNWTWSKSASGKYTDLYNCRVTDQSGSATGIQVKLFYRDTNSDDWSLLHFTIVNGQTVSAIGKCAINALGVSKSCASKRTTYSPETDLQFKACVMSGGVCTSIVTIGAVFNR